MHAHDGAPWDRHHAVGVAYAQVVLCGKRDVFQVFQRAYLRRVHAVFRKDLFIKRGRCRRGERFFKAVELEPLQPSAVDGLEFAVPVHFSSPLSVEFPPIPRPPASGPVKMMLFNTLSVNDKFGAVRSVHRLAVVGIVMPAGPLQSSALFAGK